MEERMATAEGNDFMWPGELLQPDEVMPAGAMAEVFWM